jgi:hypothetical protein
MESIEIMEEDKSNKTESCQCQLSLMASIALHRISSDPYMDEDMKKDALMCQFKLSTMDWQNDVRNDTHISSIVYSALKKWESDGLRDLPPHQRGDVRSMMGDILYWKKETKVSFNLPFN